MANTKLYVVDQNEGELLAIKLVDPGDGTGYSIATSDASDSGGSVAASTATVTSVASSATNVTIQSANVARLGLSIYNDSVAQLYLKLGITASAVSFTLKMEPSSYYEVPFGYTGRVDGIWAIASGSARVTEYT